MTKFVSEWIEDEPLIEENIIAKLNRTQAATRRTSFAHCSASQANAAARPRITIGPEDAEGLWMNMARPFHHLQVRIETLAENHSVPGLTGLRLEDTLTALTSEGRLRVTKLLERARAFDDPATQAAAAHIMRLAERKWSCRTAG